MAKKLLDLSTIDPERSTIAIDGAEYDLHTADDFGVAELSHIIRLQETINGILQEGSADTSAALRMMAALDEFVCMVLPGLPQPVLAKLRRSQKEAIIQAFQAAAGVKGKPSSQKPPLPRKHRTGAA